MANNIGIWHKTTIQSALEAQQTYKTDPVAGHKRTLIETQSGVSVVTDNRRRPSASRPALTAPIGPPRLTASIIDSSAGCIPDGSSEYSQRQEFSATPGSTADPLLSLAHGRYGLSHELVANFYSLGIKTIYPWQKNCLLGPGLLEGEKNLVYSAPTGGGKSLVADILMLKRVLEDPDVKALLVLPYVALVQEKVRWLRNVVQGISREALGQKQEESNQKLWARRPDRDTVRVVGFFGGSKVKATWADFDIGVCTIEKANSLVNTAIDDCSIPKLRVVVLDELHMIDDDYRGYLLELMATKLLCVGHQIQIIGMSATLTNINLLKSWLQGHSFETHYRPVPIEEHLVYEGRIYPAGTTSQLIKAATHVDNGSQSRLQPTRVIRESTHKEFKDPVLNAVVALANETARSGYGALVFASTRAGCESNALLISRVMPSFNEADLTVQERRIDLLGNLRSLSTGLDRTLEQTIPRGVGFHRRCAGLTVEERDLIANAYDSGVIKVCVATCSLAAGINLPARRVILHNARMGRDLVGPSLLRQMRGRAGRKGKDEVGETYLCCRPTDLEEVVDLMNADLPQISSCLISNKRRIQRAILEAIAIRLATSKESLDDFVGKTMLSYSAAVESIQSNVESSLTDLQSMGFISVDTFSNFQVTQLGQAIVASSLDPEDGVFIHNELKKALQAFVMDGDMHVLYSFTPVHDLGSVTINWRAFWNEMERLDDSGLRAMGLLGLKPSLVGKMVSGGNMKETTAEEKEVALRYRRFYLALQLRDLCNEVPIHRVAQKYGTPRGAVQNLSQTCQGFAAGMIKFCEYMGWGAMAAALDHFSDRLKAGARADLLALAKITFIKSRTARIFWDNGFKTVAAVANADPYELVPILLQAQPNKLRLAEKDEEKYTEKLLAKAKVIADSANRIWQMEMQQDLDEE